MWPLVARALLLIVKAVAVLWGLYAVRAIEWQNLLDGDLDPYDGGEDDPGWSGPIKAAIGAGALVLIAIVLARGRK